MPVGSIDASDLKVVATFNGEKIGEFEIPTLTQTEQAEPVYERIRISFLHAGSIVVDDGDWDDYEIYDGFLVIKKDEAWIAMYNMEEIFSVVLEK